MARARGAARTDRNPAEERRLVMGRFALFAECALTGVWLTVALLPLVTALAGFTAGCRHLARAMRGEGAGPRELAADLRAALRGSWWLSLLGWAAPALLLVNVLIAQMGLPGGWPVAAFTAVVTVAVLVTGMRAAAAWRPGADWTGLVRMAARHTLREDVPGSLLLAAGVAVLALVTWQLAPLFVPMVGCLAAAAVAVHHRHRRVR